MWFLDRREEAAFRPAPFAVYGDDPGRRRLERARRLLGSLLPALALLPAAAGPANEPILPVDYARIELPARVPCTISLDLGCADPLVQPPRLGHFSGSGDFIYSGQVSRGLIFGMRAGTALVLEITAPLDLDSYIERQLTDIRQHVGALNEHRNLLRLAREYRPLEGGPLAEDVGRLWQKLEPDLTATLAAEQQAAIAVRYGDQLGELTQALLTKARHHAHLKRLYYQGQEARLRLMLSQFNLQLGLAQMPHQEFDSLPSLGNASVVRDTMLGEIDRLRRAWESRRQELERRVAADRQLLEGAARSAPSSPPDPLGAVLEPSPYRTPQPAELIDRSALDPVLQLQLGIAAARLVVTSEELVMLEDGLEHLAAAAQQTRAGGWSHEDAPPRHEPQFAFSRLSSLEQLDAYTAAEEAAQSPESTVILLHRLAASFESGAGGNDPQWYPKEVAYGLLSVDLSLADPLPGPVGERSDGRGEFILRELDKILAFPTDYDSSASGGGYLRFVRWYVERALRGYQPVTPPDNEPGNEEQPEVEPQVSDVRDRADVDRLLN